MSDARKSTFALFFGNRGFFPASHQLTARAEMADVLGRLGHKTLMLPAEATQHGAVESPAEGRVYAEFLAQNRGQYDGVILCLPNFGDETGAIAALKDAGVPILVHAYPDEMDKMSPALRRDAFCGKFSVMDVFFQYGLKFTALQPHVVAPSSATFAQNVDYFDRLCRVVGGLRGMVVGAIGARTTAFKTVRIDELALQRHDITMETVDLSEVMARVRALDGAADDVKAKAGVLRDYTTWDGVPDEKFALLCKLGVAIDSVVDEFAMDAVAVRCWVEMQQQLGVSPCVLVSEMNNRMVATACEVDVGNAVMMHALRLASGDVATCLDWNNNVGDEADKCILFHCGPVPQAMMTAKGCVTSHAILDTVVGKGCGWGCNQGRIRPTPMTFGSLLTDGGRIKTYLGQGRFTDDAVPEDFFGCAGIAEVPDLQSTLQTIGYAGHRHHTSVTPTHVAAPVQEAFEKYLGFDVEMV